MVSPTCADGFSRQKNRYVRALAAAIEGGTLDLEVIARLEDVEVRHALVALPGIGPWTAEVYLLSALRRPDTWPTGDIALQEGARCAKRLELRPSPEELEAIGEAWRPHRASAARLLWHLYLSENGRREMAITCAPASLASFVRIAPRKPMPITATVCPATISLRWKMFIAQPRGSPGNGCPASVSGSLATDPTSAMSNSA